MKKKIDATGYLIAAIVSVFITLAFTYPVAPLFLKWFVPFPALEEATVYEGVLHIKGGKKARSRRTKTFGSAPTYYIIDKQGEKHKIFFGYFGNKRSSYASEYEGMRIKAWFHPLFGVINSQTLYPPAIIKVFPEKKGVTGGTKYIWRKEYFELRFDYEKYYWRAITPFCTLVFTIFYFIRFWQLRKEQQHGR